MFNPRSPFKNFPSNLDRRHAFYLDGIRHSAEIIECAFTRLSINLTKLTQTLPNHGTQTSYANFYLDAWAFVDALDRLLALWKLQPNSKTIPAPWSPSIISKELRDIRKIRNVSDHMAQRADQIISSNTAALGELSWVTVLSSDPPKMKSCLIRPGFLPRSLALQMNLPKGSMYVKHSTGNIKLKALTHTANLSSAYEKIQGLIVFAESDIKKMFEANRSGWITGGDLIASCDLDLSGREFNGLDALTRR